MLGWIIGKFGFTRLTTAQTWEKPPPSPIQYTLWLSMRPTSKWHFYMGLPNGSPSKFPKLGLLQLWGPIILCVDLRLRWDLKKSCSPCRDFFKGMWHTTYTQGNRGDSWLLVSKVKLPIWLSTLLLAIICVLSVQMGHASPL